MNCIVVEQAEPTRLARTLDWHLKHIENYQPYFPGHHYREDKDTLAWRSKPLCELIYLVLILHRLGLASPEYTALQQRTLRAAREFEWEALMAEDPSSSVCVAMAMDLFALHAVPMHGLRAQFLRARASGYFHSVLRIPFRDMDYHYMMSKVVSGGGPGALEGGFAMTAFGLGKNPCSYTVNDIYSLTHALFYLTDMGAIELDRLTLGVADGRLRQTLMILVAMLLRGDNNDVLGELLICVRICGLSLDGFEQRLCAQALAKILSGMAPDGCVPSSARSIERAACGNAKFLEVYHTTLVASILLGLGGE
ncbi:hypothetical protein [Stenotrophomonas sp. C1657]|uniref:DUF6895 family protein n=1 Tax=Stenotrophomonas sp. C1657 TaxID=3077844 RepID=UPI00293C4895|nr:hypothetical protein [Stenotrophomonas sp. C1657]MDV3513555.1 hypothetical protein [Stenotrophomonas sp. C1657]